jgi:hypothetical protein
MDIAHQPSVPRGLTALRLQWPWRYQGDSGARDLRLDLLRGWCLFSMVIDHAVGEHQTFVLRVTGGGPYPLTGAHGFVFLSGIVFGLIYCRIIAIEGWRQALRKALGRGLTLYLVAVALGFVGLLFSLTPWGGGTPLGEALSRESVLQTVILKGNNDSLMTLYFLLIMLAPIALFLMQRGFTWLVLGASLGIWIGHLHLPDHFANPVEIFVPTAEWQVLFIAGLVIGYHRESIRRFLRGWRRRLYLVVVFSLFAVVAAVQIAMETGRLETLIPGLDLTWLNTEIYTDYDHNPPLHFLAIFVIFLTLYHVVDWLWAPLKGALGWFLIPIGGATLYVYIVHTLVVYYLLLNVPAFTSLDGFWLGIVLLGLMVVFWAMVRTRFLYRIVPR